MSYVSVGALTRMAASSVGARAVPVTAAASQANFGASLQPTVQPATATLQQRVAVPQAALQPTAPVPQASLQPTVQPATATLQQRVAVPQAALQPVVPSAQAALQPATPVAPSVWAPVQAASAIVLPNLAPALSPISPGLQYARIPPPAPRVASRAPVRPAPRPPASGWFSRPSGPLVAPPPPVTSYLPSATFAVGPASAITNTQQVTLPAPVVREPDVSAGPSRRDWMVAGLIGLAAVGAAAWYVKKKG